MSAFVFHPDAVGDLEDIWEFIAADSQPSADRVIEEIFTAIRGLARFPYAGHQRPDLTKRPQRFHLVGKYLIAYAPEQNPLLITAVLHGKRNPKILAAILSRRR